MKEMRNGGRVIIVLFVLLIHNYCLSSDTMKFKKNWNSQIKNVMPWMCLERCGASPIDIYHHLQQIADHLDVINSVSFEKYNLGANSKLVVNNLTDVLPALKNLGVATFPMISSFPYPKEFIEWCRQLFDNPTPFIQTCIEEAQKYGYSGYNVDFEPTVGIQDGDGKRYAQFLDKFAKALHSIGRILTIDIATWTTFWDLDALSQTSVDRIISMSTYTGNMTIWEIKFLEGVQKFGVRFGVGLQTVNPNTGKPLSNDELKFRFDHIENFKTLIQEVDVWNSPLYDNMFPFLQKFVTAS